jgi:N-acetyl-alpha-D-muramate 1-phosphate uridylyltransferase
MPKPLDAIILAAGMGSRMMPLTKHLPKALIQVMGKPLLGYILDRLKSMKLKDVVINSHYRGDVLEAALSQFTDMTFRLSPEQTLLETGGGVKQALPLLCGDYFYVINCDSLWLDGYLPALERLIQHYDPATMDGLLLLYRTALLPDDHSCGDFQMDSLGIIKRRSEGEVTPYMFMGVQILHRRLFDQTLDGAFSLNILYDQAISEGRLYGLLHDGLWFHVSQPEDISHTEYRLKQL